MKRTCFTFSVIFLLLLSFNSKAQRVEMLCIQVDTAGRDTISWQGTAIPIDYEYQLYYSNTFNGTYSPLPLGTVLPPTSFFVHETANGGSSQWFYFVKAVPIPPATGATYTSDTLGNIRFFTDPATGIVHLSWSQIAFPPFPTQDKDFVVLRGEGGILSPQATSDTTYYFDTVHVCGKVIDYQISLYDNRGCYNTSIIRSGSVKDGIPPETPQLDSVSVNLTTNKTELGWNPSKSSDTYGYIIYHKNENGIWLPLDTVLGAENTYYVDLKNDATNEVQKYCIAAIDTCYNASPIGDTLNTILPDAACEKCDSIINISWNGYGNMPDGLTGYRILASENGGSFYLVDTVLPNKLNYTHKSVNPFNSYTYYIQAYNISNGYTSSSAKIDVVCYRQAHTGKVWLRYVSVVDNKDIEVSVYVNDTIEYDRLVLFRCDNAEKRFSKINEKTKASGVDNYLFIDADVDVQTNTYFYTVSMTDECNLTFAQSDTANNIVLTAVDASADINEMEWTDYEGFDSRLDGYDVYRLLQTDVNFQLITNLPASQTDYAENVFDLASHGGKFYYQVAATEDNSNPYGFSDISFSNIIEIAKSPQSFIPNAFSPNNDGLNDVFKPVLIYVDAVDYAFAIYDRWGNQVFYTNKITEGWDGNIGGKPATAGVYNYALTYRLTEMKTYRTQGAVTLIR